MGNKAWARGNAARGVAGALVVALVVGGLAGCGGPDVPKLIGKARAAISKQDTEAARISLKTVLQKAPDNGEARFLLGQLLHDTGDLVGAEVELRRALELQYPQQQVLPLLASTLLGQNKGALLLQQFGAVQLADASAQARLQTTLAAADASSGNIDAAATRLDAVLRAQPDHGPALLLRSRLVAARGDSAGALAQVRALLARESSNSEAWQLQGDLLLHRKAGEPAPPSGPAIAAYQEAIKHKPGNVGAHTAIIGLQLAAADIAAANAQWAALKKAAPRNPQTLFFDAVLSEQRGDLAHAREVAQQLLRSAPTNLPLLLVAGQVEMRLNALAQAEQLLGKAVQLAPKAAAPRQQLAQVLLRTGQADKALTTLAPVLEGDAATVDALTLAAQAHLIQGDTAAADASFARAAKLRPDDPRVRLALALSNVAKGKGGAGLADLRAAAAADKGTTADLALISVLSRSNDLPGALKAIDALAAKVPKDALPDQLRGRLALQAKDSAAARGHFDAALAKNPDFLPALAGLAALDLADKQPAAAKARFEALLKRNPKNTAAMLALAELSARTGGKPEEVAKWINGAVAADPNDAAARLMQVDQLLNGNQTKAAIDAAQAGLGVLPGNAELLDRLGRAQLASGQALQAVGTFTKLAAAAPKSALPQLRLADAHVAARNPGAAAAAVRRAGEIAPDQLPVQQAQVMMALQENRLDQAMAIARQVQAKRPGEAVGFGLEGDIELHRKNWDAVAVVLRKALARSNPGNAAQRLHVALSASKKTAEASALAQDWRKKHPDDSAFVLYLGDQAMATGQLAEAEVLYRQVMEQQPNQVLALNNLAYVLATQKKPGAVALAEQALKLAPRSPAVMDTLATALAAEQQLPRAIVVQKKAVAAAPDVYSYRLQLARLMVRSGDKANARSELSALAALGNKFSRQAEVAALIKDADR